MNQEIRFCTASDGTRLAYAKVGQGPALVKVGNWMSHLEYELDSPLWKPWLENWTRFNTFYRYDPRGCGLSDRDVVDFSFNALVSDLEAVVDDAGLEQFDLFSMSQGGSISIEYAARHSERVRRLIICGGYLQGSLSNNPTREAIEKAEVFLKLFKLSWGSENPAYRQVFTMFLIPEGTPEQFKWLNNLQLVSTSPANAMSIQQSFNKMDVVESAKNVKAPTMVFHTRQDTAVPFELGRRIAALIPGAQLTILESKNHVLLGDEPAWTKLWGALYQFLGVGSEADVVKLKKVSAQDQILLDLSARERDILKLMAEGKQNLEIAKHLSLSEKTVRNYISNIYAKLQINSRGEAIVLARNSGLLEEK